MFPWEMDIQRLVEEENKSSNISFPAGHVRQDGKRYVVFSPVPWVQGNFERMISVALQLRGHHVDEVYCGGNFPACGVEHVSIERPSCDVCTAKARRWFANWQLEGISSETFIDIQDHRKADHFVDGLDIDGLFPLDYDVLNQITYQNLPAGRRTYEKLYWYFSSDFSDDARVRDYMIKCFKAYALGVHLAKAVLDRCTYDAVVLCNGKTIEAGPFMDVALEKQVRVVVWEELFAFCNNTPLVERDLRESWPIIKKEPFSDEQRQEINEWMAIRTQHKQKTDICSKRGYVDDPISDAAELTQILGLRSDSFKVVLFTNVATDTTLIGMNRGFKSMHHWINWCIEYAAANPDIDLIIRAHPAERMGHYIMPQTMIDYIKARFPKVPENVILIPGSSNISSYTLLDMVDIPMTYAGTLSLEAPALGRRCAVAGRIYFVDPTLMVEVLTPEHLKELFDRRCRLPELTEEEQDLALQNAHFYYLRYLTEMNFYDPKKTDWHIHSLDLLRPGGNVFWDNLCDSIIHNHAFIDLNRPNREPIIPITPTPK